MPAMAKILGWKTRARAHVKTRIAHAVANNEHLTFFVPSDMKKISHCDQFDASQNNPEAFAKRDRIRTDPAVVTSMKKWWDAMGGEQGIGLPPLSQP